MISRDARHARGEAKRPRNGRALMPGIQQIRWLPYSAEQMFDLVADVGRYGEFLPWIVATRVKLGQRGRRWSPTCCRLQGAAREVHLARRESAGRRRSGSTMSTGRSRISTIAGCSARSARKLRVDFLGRVRFPQRLVREAGRAVFRQGLPQDGRRLRGAGSPALRQQQLQRDQRRLIAHGRPRPCLRAAFPRH
jgi:hypothetical protein